MSWTKLLARWRQATLSSSEAPHADEIDEELMYHLRALVDDNVARGMPSDEAWRAAQQRFGSLRRYSDDCRKLSLGHYVLWQRLPAVGIVVLGVLVTWLLFEVRNLRQTQSPAEPNDFVGRVIGPDDQPVAGAHVLVVRKTWPDGRYRQQDFATRSDGHGRFRLPRLVPAEGQYAFQVTAAKDGFALASNYQHIEDGRNASIENVELKLDTATPIRLIVHDGQGAPVADARVIPASRRSPDGRENLVYFQGSEPLEIATDAQGRAELSCFQRQDEATIYVRVPRGEWAPHTVEIPVEEDIIVLVVGNDSHRMQPARFRSAKPSTTPTNRVAPPVESEPGAIDEALLGTWTVVAAINRGYASPADTLEEMELTWHITKDRIRWNWRKVSVAESQGEDGADTEPTYRVDPDDVKESAITYRVDPAHSPRWIDQRDDGGPPTLGIYEIDGDTLRVCTSEGDYRSERPTAFESKPDSPNMILMVLKRNQAAPETPSHEDQGRQQLPGETELALAAPNEQAPADVADVPSRDLLVNGNKKMRYFLIGGAAEKPDPTTKYGLLVVLPGGDGSADYNAFIRRMYKNALDMNWLVAQAVAPKWDSRQFDELVWPTAGLPYKQARFTTETFVESIIADVQSKAQIDPQRTFVMGWSSGGPPAYATAIDEDSPVAGAIIAMSVFKPDLLPPIANAGGKSFYLLQSPDDRVTSFRFAEAAQSALDKAGAKVHLERYAGGHGWHGNVYQMISDGIHWLEQQVDAQP